MRKPKGDFIRMNQTHTSSLLHQTHSATLPLAEYPGRLGHIVERTARSVLRPFRQGLSMSISELLQRVETAVSPRQLTSVMNTLQNKLWSLPREEQTLFRERMAEALVQHVLHSSSRALRLEAAGWLRMFAQAAYLPQPERIFVTLVTAASAACSREDALEERAYLNMIVDCFWMYHYPYPAYTWETFPANKVFYALAPRLSASDASIQDTLITIFTELPTLDDAEIEAHLLPIALRWAKDADSELRQRITIILARMSHRDAQEALQRLQLDTNPFVRASARRASEHIRRA